MAPSLELLGYTADFRDAFEGLGRADLVPGRIVAAHMETYTVHNGTGVFRADITGNLRFGFDERADFPSTGDWVAMAVFDGDYAVIHHLLPRRGVLARRAASEHATAQVIGANIDVAFIMQSVGRDFSLNRLDRYIAVSHAGGIEPAVLLSKIDLADPASLAAMTSEIRERHPAIRVTGLSNLAAGGLDEVRGQIEAGKTYCVLGSSGVGKSTLINALMGEESMATQEVSDWNQRGRHTTSHRALFLLPTGAVMIDTPGMRELGMAEGTAGLEKTFEDIYTLAEGCRFSDCRHVGEPGCAVRAAITSGALSAEKFENYAKMLRETAYFESSVAEKRKKARSQGKLIKRILSEKEGRRF